MSIYSRASFWSGVRDRAIKTFAQVLVSTLTVGVGILDINWKGALGLTATAVLISVLTSIADAKETDRAIATAPVEYTPRHAG
nr:MAG TPA: holin [Caudoviricetes sp.]